MNVYRFLNSNGEVIYVGRAENINNRMNKHNHLNNKCYRNVTNIKYCKLNSMTYALANVY